MIRSTDGYLFVRDILTEQFKFTLNITLFGKYNISIYSQRNSRILINYSFMRKNV